MSLVIWWRRPLANHEEVVDQVVTIPNLISLVRILAVPYFVWLLLGAKATAAAGLVLIAIGSTDWLDGYLARRLGQVSKLGKTLDPVADRLAIIAAILAGWAAGILPGWLVIGLLIREFVMASLAGWLYLRHRQTIAVRNLGKLATLMLYSAIPAFFLAAAGVAESFLNGVANIVGGVGLVLYWAVVFGYAQDIRTTAEKSLSSGGTSKGAA